MARMLMFMGALILLAGIIWYFAEKFGLKFPGRLPGDLFIKRGNTTIYIPVLTSIILSVVISLLLWVISKAKL